MFNIEDRIADFEFPKKIIPQLWKIENPENCFIIASPKDAVLNQKLLFNKSFNHVELLEVDDTHRLENFRDYLPKIKNYIQSKL